MHRGWIIAAALVLAGPVAAQDGSEGPAQRTPENAQRFLTEFFGQGGFGAVVALRLRGAGGYGPYREQETGDWALTYGRIAGWAALDRCRSRIELEDVRAVYDGPAFGYAPQQLVFDIDWARVTSTNVTPQAASMPIRASHGPTVNRMAFAAGMAMRGGERLPSLLFDTKEEADRVGFALDFLRRECGLKSDTGF